MLEDSFKYMKAGDTAVLAAGDGDFLPAIQSLQARGLAVRVVSWSHAVSRHLRDTADEYLALDSHFDSLSHIMKIDQVLRPLHESVSDAVPLTSAAQGSRPNPGGRPVPY